MGLRVFETVRNLFLKEGLVGFYRGIPGPIVSLPIVNAVVFSTYTLTR